MDERDEAVEIDFLAGNAQARQAPHTKFQDFAIFGITNGRSTLADRTLLQHLQLLMSNGSTERIRQDSLGRNPIRRIAPRSCYSNVGWYSQQEPGAPYFKPVITGAVGVYVIWQKDDYCSLHDRFHMKALYAGKGQIERRLFNHWANKDFSQEHVIYWTFIEVPNRKAKYLEQLLLDIYRFPHNYAENSGTAPLCAHMTQIEVD